MATDLDRYLQNLAVTGDSQQEYKQRLPVNPVAAATASQTVAKTATTAKTATVVQASTGRDISQPLIIQDGVRVVTVTGPAGPTGPQGPTGPTGPTGPQGATGLKGDDGVDVDISNVAGQGLVYDSTTNTLNVDQGLSIAYAIAL